MESLGSYIRSAARATFSAYRTVPIRWRLAGGSAALTFVILAGFAAIVGVLTTQPGARAVQRRGALRRRPARAAQLHLSCKNGVLDCFHTTIHLSDYASAEQAQIRIYDDTDELLCTQDKVIIKGAKLPAGHAAASRRPTAPATSQELGYRVAVRDHGVSPIGEVKLLYARPLSDVDHTLARVQFFLLLGVLGGTVLALLAGLATAQRAMRPIAELTDAAREIERTRDPSRRLPRPEADDEVAELARTLEGMLGGA